MEYEYSITVTYDSAPTPNWVGRYSDALTAVQAYLKFVDVGFANEYVTINLSEPSGKMHTKIIDRMGKVTTR
jgi:hypothetical protein